MASLAEYTAELVGAFLQPAEEIEALRAALKGRGMPVLVRVGPPASANPTEGDKITISDSWLTPSAASVPSPLQPVATLCSGVTAPRYVLRSCECVLAIPCALPSTPTPSTGGRVLGQRRKGSARLQAGGHAMAIPGGAGMPAGEPAGTSPNASTTPVTQGPGPGPVVFAATLVCLDQQLQGTDYYRSTRTVFFVMTERDLQQQRQGSYPLSYA